MGMDVQELDLPPARKRRKISRYFPAFIAWFLIVGATAVFFAFPGAAFWEKHSSFAPPLVVVHAVLVAALLANFAVAMYLDPGFLPKALADEIPADEFRSPLYKTVDIKNVQIRLKWCVTCNLYRPPRTSHCSTCNRCIEVFDHHCPWVANCVGRRNYRYFLYFLITLCLHMLGVFAVSLLVIIEESGNLAHATQIAAIVLVILVGLLIFPIGGLTCFHFHLVVKANTTNEQVTGKFKNSINPYNRGCIKNCCFIFCGPLYDKYDEHTEIERTIVQKPKEKIPFSPSASPTPLRVEMPDGLEKTTGAVAVTYTVPANTKPTSFGYAFKPATSSPNAHYDNLQGLADRAHDLSEEPHGDPHEVPHMAPVSSPTSTAHVAIPRSQANIRLRMDPVIAELIARAPSASVSSQEGGYYSSTDDGTAAAAYASTPVSADYRLRQMDASMPPDAKVCNGSSNAPRHVPSRQESCLTSSGASTSSTLDRPSVDLSQRLVRTVDGRMINSPRHSTRKSKAYGSALREDFRSSRSQTDDGLPPRDKNPFSAKAVSTSNLLQEKDNSLSLYRKNPALGSQPSVAILEGNRKPRPPSFVQALETTDSIEQLALLTKVPSTAGNQHAARKSVAEVFGEISV